MEGSWGKGEHSLTGSTHPKREKKRDISPLPLPLHIHTHTHTHNYLLQEDSAGHQCVCLSGQCQLDMRGVNALNHTYSSSVTNHEKEGMLDSTPVLQINCYEYCYKYAAHMVKKVQLVHKATLTYISDKKND